MKLGSLFSGIGGLDLGFERAGFEILWQVEKDTFCQKILRKHWPHTEIYGDVTTVDFTSLPPVEGLIGGFPCQDISPAGSRKGITGEKSGLWEQYARAIGEIRPRFACIENSSALPIRGLDRILSDLAALGYDAEWVDIPAAALGAPHLRHRCFVFAYANGLRAPHEAEPFFTRKSQPCESGSNAAHFYSLDANGSGFDSGGFPFTEPAHLPGSQADASHAGCVGRIRPEEAKPRTMQIHPNGNGAVQKPERAGIIHAAPAGGSIAPNTDCERLAKPQKSKQPIGEKFTDRTTPPKPANTPGQGLPQRQSRPGNADQKQQTTERVFDRLPEPNQFWEQWTTEPPLCRVDDGISPRLDRTRRPRLQGLGNAVVPQVAEFVARCIARFFEMKEVV